MDENKNKLNVIFYFLQGGRGGRNNQPDRVIDSTRDNIYSIILNDGRAVVYVSIKWWTGGLGV